MVPFQLRTIHQQVPQMWSALWHDVKIASFVDTALGKFQQLLNRIASSKWWL